MVEKILTIKATKNHEKIAYLVMKYNNIQAQKIKTYLIDSFQPQHFPSMSFKENWQSMVDSRELGVVREVLSYEVGMVEQHLETFREQVVRGEKKSVLHSLRKMIREDREWEWEMTEKTQKRETLEKYLREYTRGIERSSREYLLHLNEVLDLLRMDWLFSGLMETGKSTLSSQHYIQMLSQMNSD